MLQHQQNNHQISKATFTILNPHNSTLLKNAISIDYRVKFNEVQFPHTFLSEAYQLFKSYYVLAGTWVCTWVLGCLGAWACTWGAASHIMRRVDYITS